MFRYDFRRRPQPLLDDQKRPWLHCRSSEHASTARHEQSVELGRVGCLVPRITLEVDRNLPEASYTKLVFITRRNGEVKPGSPESSGLWVSHPCSVFGAGWGSYRRLGHKKAPPSRKKRGKDGAPTNLANPGKLRTQSQIHIPDAGLISQALQPDLAFFPAAKPADPRHAELGFFLAQLHLQDGAGLDLPADAVDQGPSVANVFDGAQRHERQRIGVHAPDTHRQTCGNAWTATTIHKPLSLGTLSGGKCWGGLGDITNILGERKLTLVIREGYPSYL